ncbi:transglycosylase domain-containing protein [Streptomyces sp. S.PNR 29]|uniref:transglycosylase domain-containing protein n=1 Tax=Streptomyces sp. S.PNR 29 TaxID=2973805 RepID=UPI0025B0D54E|nr:transglycosylase domain-containing protein [Streptomyces sp. S.PNR 29]MDN0197096.1 transglycosylase domain-containing protein [Streptomyces sp. S.PNR 29]
MSDEPQPQQPKPGWAQREPEAAQEPGEQAEQPEQPAQGERAERAEQGAGKPERPQRTGWRRLIPTWRMVLGGFVVAVLLLIGGFFLGYSMVKIPPANALATQQANVYLYADGSVIARDGEVNRENVTLAQMSKDAQHAILAAEDRDFYTESAVDPGAMVRAAWNTATGKGKQSGSTITQQYVKNYYLRQDQTVTRKVKEFFIAIKLDREQSKDKILEGYLNTSFFGRNAYGIQAAAQAYYGMDAKDLDAGRAAYLAALVNAPSQYDVVAHPENRKAAQARWNYVLDGMVTKGWLSESERAGMKFPMPKETTLSTGMSGQRGYIVRTVKDYLVQNKIVDESSLDAGGYRITTTLQKSKQDAFVKAVDDQLMKKLDKDRKVDSYVRAGGASIDPRTGKVVAMYNGIDYVKQYTPNATRRDFQVGSTFKPFVFTSAVENGSRTQDGRTITPNTIYDGTNKRPVQGWSGGTYDPENEDQRSYGDITVREATDKSVNSVYAQMAVDVGSDKVMQTAVDLGLPEATPELNPSPSIALGVATASVLDMAEAYATLANHGKHGTYTMIQSVTKDGDQEIQLPKRRTRQAVSREAADTTTSVLRSVVETGTATGAQAAGRPAAGKTGTAEEDTAAWFAGYTPDLATVVSVMGQDPVTAAHKSLYGVMGLDRINGGGAPTDIWAQFTKDALKGKPVTDFDLQLQPGADIIQAPPAQPDVTTPGTDDPTDDGTATGGEETPGETPDETPSETDGTATGGGTTTDGTTGDTTTGGTPTTGGTTDGGTTDGGTTGDTDTGGTTTDGTTGGPGGGTTGTTNGGTAGTLSTNRRQ